MITGEAQVLIADDDPVSRTFFEAAVGQCGCRPIAVADAAAALASARPAPHRFALLLLDRRMPGTGGSDLLFALRALGVDAPAVATSAELGAATERELRDAGFAATLPKPATLGDVRALLRCFIMPDAAFAEPAGKSRGAAPGTPAVLDDATAIVAVGDAQSLHALRKLFVAELASIEFRPPATDGEATVLAERLHRLQASCGICGAILLRDASIRLEQVMRGGPEYLEAFAAFVAACTATRLALESLA